LVPNSAPFGQATSRSSPGFTLIEIVFAIFIMVMLLLLAVPSLNGVLADRRLRHSLDNFNSLVREAQEHSVSEHRAYLIVWGENDVFVRPEAFAKDEEHSPIANFPLDRGSTLALSFPAALTKKQPGEWIFWPTGTCEAAVIHYEDHAGKWTESYSPLTAQGELLNYAAR
jgi:type II secretory pathway pseudopilin PulG